MKPVAIFRHASTEGPGYFATSLDRRNIPWKLVAVDRGEPVPSDSTAYGGLAFMGGPMSVNDDLPWILSVTELIRDAVRTGVPVIGHCLGGQLMSKALGGTVTRNPVKEVGWGDIRVLDDPEARRWFGHAAPVFRSFHWHGETFSIPQGAVRLLESDHCPNQAFALGRHLAMQCHIEMTEALVETWCSGGAREIAESRASPAVQDPDAIRADLASRVAALHRVAEAVYDRWIEGLAR